VAEEEKNDQVEETTPDETPAEEAPAQEAPATEAPAAEAPAEEAPAADAPAEEAAAPAPPAEPAEPVEQLSARERRRRARSRKNRRPKFTGTPEEKAVQRAAWRKKKAASRRASRLKAREARKAAGPREGTPPAVKEPGRKKIQQGTVVSSKNDKTITVRIDNQESHRVYKKVVRSSSKIAAHDEKNDANEGDVVRVIESRPLSKNKRWRLVEVVERAR
jgi:small subunit ribosomal protein S17